MSTEPRYGIEDVKQFSNPSCRPLGSFLLLSCPMSISQVTPDSLPGSLSLSLSLLPNEAKESKWENIRTKESERERETEEERKMRSWEGREGGGPFWPVRQTGIQLSLGIDTIHIQILLDM